LRAKPTLAHLKIIAYTAHAGSQDQQRYLTNGFDAVLVKPISLQRLKDAIADVI
jgi:CheY-like chemotaxis protein